VLAVLCSVLVPGGMLQAQWRIGGSIGGEHDSSWDEFLVVGAQARGGIMNRRFEINPQFVYFLRSGFTQTQVAVNLLKPLVLASPGALEPYVGVGVGVEMFSFDSPGAEGETNLTHQYVVGATTRSASALQLFGQFQYTVDHQAGGNSMVASAGLLFRLGGGSSAARVTKPLDR
jgi:hypothetical protein